MRTPWTLSSDENWARTQRLAGFTFCTGGLIALLGALSNAPVLSFGVVVVSGLVPAVYSFLLARRLPPEA